MKLGRILSIFLAAMIILLVISGCENSNEKNNTQMDLNQSGIDDKYVTLLVTKDFGKETLFDKKVEIKDDYTVIDILEKNLEITTKWDGGFVSEINKIKSDNGGIGGQRKDWFYFVNGVCADVGAMGYELSKHDIVWWDYHPWESMSANTAVIGCYPEPFIHGYAGKIEPTIIMTSSDKLSLANSLKKSLESKGVIDIKIKELSEKLLENRLGPTILIGQWDELKNMKYLTELNSAYKKTGINLYFTDNGVELLKYDGTVAKKVKNKVGIIASIGEGLGDHKPLWLIIGTDDEGLKGTIDVLSKNPEKIKKMYSAAVVQDEIISLPIR